jgi:hypothetical protein
MQQSPAIGGFADRPVADFSATFTTIAFDHSSLRWLEIDT